MPKPLIQRDAPQGREEARLEPARGEPDVTTILALYRSCVERSYSGCEVLKQMAVDKIKERLRDVVAAKVAEMVGQELAGEIGEVCVKI